MAVSESIVRECFERHGFLVRQCRKHVAPGARDEEDIDFLVLNPRPEPASEPLPFVLESAEPLRHLSRAVVAVRGWHTETFSPARLTGTPEFFRFVEPESLQQALRAFGPGPAPVKILVLPGLPHTPALRRQSITLLRERGVDVVVPFRVLLADLIEHVEPNRNYQKSDLLQTLRLLKLYEFFHTSQLDLFKPPRRRRPARRAQPVSDGSDGAAGPLPAGT